MAVESGMINIRFPHFAPMTSEDTADNPPVYGQFVRISEATTLTRTPTIQNVPAYGDGVIVESFAGTPGGNVALGVHALPQEVANVLFGARFDAKGVQLSSSGDRAPYGALAFEAQKGNGKTRWTVLYKVKFQVPELSLSQKTDTVTWQQPTLNGTYQSRLDFYTDENGERINLLYGEYDQDRADFEQRIADGWYADVYQPTAPNAIPVTGVVLSQSTMSLAQGDTRQLTATVSPAAASNKAVDWSSSDESAATVSPTGLVTGVAAGTSNVTVTTRDGGKTATCKVTVTGG